MSTTTTTAEINGDVHTPDDGVVFANSAADAIGMLATHLEQSIAALHGQEGVTGPSIEYLTEMHAEAGRLQASYRGRAARFAGHVATRNDNVNSETAGTQRGRYFDPSGQHQ